MTANKLSVNMKYLLYTKYNTIPGVNVDVVGIMNYDEAILLPYSIISLAINEKVVDVEDETENYLREQLYYKCVNKSEDGKETIYVVWDNIIDSERTTRLSVEYSYTMKLTVDANLDTSLSDIINDIHAYIVSTYGASVTPVFTQTGVGEYDSENNELNEYKKLVEESKTIVSKIASLKQIETLIDYFAKDDMMEKISEINESLTNIQDTVSTISDMIN